MHERYSTSVTMLHCPRMIENGFGMGLALPSHSSYPCHELPILELVGGIQRINCRDVAKWQCYISCPLFMNPHHVQRQIDGWRTSPSACGRLVGLELPANAAMHYRDVDTWSKPVLQNQCYCAFLNVHAVRCRMSLSLCEYVQKSPWSCNGSNFR